MDLSYSKITLETIRPQNLGFLLIKRSQSFNLWSSDSNLVLSYLVTTVFVICEPRGLFGPFALCGPFRFSSTFRPHKYHSVPKVIFWIIVIEI